MPPEAPNGDHTTVRGCVSYESFLGSGYTYGPLFVSPRWAERGKRTDHLATPPNVYVPLLLCSWGIIELRRT